MTPSRVALVVLAAGVLAGTRVWLGRALRVWRAERAELTWQPPPGYAELPADREGIEEIREVSWALADGSRQRAFYLPPRNGAVVVYAHGSPGTGIGRLREARALAGDGFGALLLDLPGYGGSEGRRTWGRGFREAVAAAVDYVAARPEARHIGGFGYSMSTALMAQAAADDPRLEAIVLLTPFTRSQEQLHHQFRSRIPGLSHVAILSARHHGLAVDELDTTQAMRRLGPRPVLLVAGEHDGAIPLWMPRQLKDLSPGAELWIVPGAGHEGFAREFGEVYLERIRAFYRLHLLGDPPR